MKLQQLRHPLGQITVVECARDESIDSLASSLHEEEQRAAGALVPARARTFVLGRTALRSAGEQLGEALPPVTSTPRGGPRLPAEMTGSISHKRIGDRWIAVALLREKTAGCVGIDVESLAPSRIRIAKKILTDAELARIEGLDETEAWLHTAVRFSVKESIYKAIDPYLGRYVAFREAEVDWEPPLTSAPSPIASRMQLSEPGEGDFELETYAGTLEDGLVLSAAQVRRR